MAIGRPPKFRSDERRCQTGGDAGEIYSGKEISVTEISRSRKDSMDRVHGSIPSNKRRCSDPRDQEQNKRTCLNSLASGVPNDHTSLGSDTQPPYASGKGAEPSTEDSDYPHAQIISSTDILDASGEEDTEAAESPMYPDLAPLLDSKHGLNDNLVYWMLDLFTAGPNKAIESHLFRRECDQTPPISAKSCRVLGPLNHGKADWVLIAIHRSKDGPASFYFLDPCEPSWKAESIEAMIMFKKRVTSIKLNDPQEMCPKQGNADESSGLRVGINGLHCSLDVTPLEHIENSWWRIFFYKLLIYKRVRKMGAQSGTIDSLHDCEVPPTDPPLPPYLQRAPTLANRLAKARKAVFEASKSFVAVCQDYNSEEKALYQLKKKKASLKISLETQTQELELREHKQCEVRDLLCSDNELFEAVINPVEKIVRKMQDSIQDTKQSLEKAEQLYDKKERKISACRRNWSQARAKARDRLNELAEALKESAEFVRFIDQVISESCIQHQNFATPSLESATMELNLSKPDSSQQLQIDRLRKTPGKLEQWFCKIQTSTEEQLRKAQQADNLHPEAKRMLSQEHPLATPAFLEEDQDVKGFKMPSDAAYLITTIKQFRRLQEVCDDLPRYIQVVDLDYDPIIEKPFLESFQDYLKTCPEAKVEIQNGRGSTTKKSCRQLLDRILDRMLVELADTASTVPEPWNCLSIDTRSIRIQATDPITSMPRFNLLQRLCSATDINRHGTISKRQTNLLSHFPEDITSSLNFLLFSLGYTWSNHHVDILDGTFISTLVGMKGWFFHADPLTEVEREEFAKDGPNWKPKLGPGGMQMAFVVPGTWFFMMPGTGPKVHSVLGFGVTCVGGGMVWDSKHLGSIVDALHWIFENNTTVTNEPIPKQIVPIVDLWLSDDSVKLAIKGKIQSLKELLLPKLSCDHPGPCTTTTCSCQTSQHDRYQGCTPWCHNGDTCPQPTKGRKN